MKKVMMVGAAVSLIFAYSVLRLLGFYHEDVSPLQIAVGLFLAGVYLVVFRVGAAKKQREALHLPAQIRKEAERVKTPGEQPVTEWREVRSKTETGELADSRTGAPR